MEDEVDRLVRGWRRALPEVDVSPLEVLSRVSRLARHLDRQRTVVLARHDLEIWSFDVLSALRRAEAPPPSLARPTARADVGVVGDDDQPPRSPRGTRGSCATPGPRRRSIGARPDHRGG